MPTANKNRNSKKVAINASSSQSRSVDEEVTSNEKARIVDGSVGYRSENIWGKFNRLTISLCSLVKVLDY